MLVEVFLILLIIAIPIIWMFWFRFTNWLYNKRYKPENDRGRKAEEARKQLISRPSRRNHSGESRVEATTQLQSSEGNSSIPPAVPAPIEQDSNSGRETGSSVRGFFGRFKRRK